MSSSLAIKPIVAAMGTALASSMLLAGDADATDNPFGLIEFDGGYMQTAQANVEGRCGEGKCGGDPSAEGQGGADQGGAGRSATDQAYLPLRG